MAPIITPLRIGLENFITVYARANGTAQPVAQPTDHGPLAPGGTVDFRIRSVYGHSGGVEVGVGVREDSALLVVALVRLRASASTRWGVYKRLAFCVYKGSFFAYIL